MRYYPADLTNQLANHTLKNDALKTALFNTLNTNHLKSATGGNDTLGCPQAGINNCYNQTVLGYNGARVILFGALYLKNDGNGYYIEDVYCQKRFGANAGVGPKTIPAGTKINCEHTWPQSKFTGMFPSEMQKSDLHHLFATDSRANSRRGNDDFTDVSHDSGDLGADCSASKYGSSTTSSQDGFEPPLSHKGNVARAIFYFSVRYKLPIPKNEEDTLRRWNDLDPVDQDEMDKNNAIEAYQGNRNPFIDFPGLANDINKF